MKYTFNTPSAVTKSVKVLDPIHHRLRVLAAQKRMPLQEFINLLLDISMKQKIYEQFLETKTE
jgi:hypothetical protein